jgi:hypothetical protein
MFARVRRARWGFTGHGRSVAGGPEPPGRRVRMVVEAPAVRFPAPP